MGRGSERRRPRVGMGRRGSIMGRRGGMGGGCMRGVGVFKSKDIIMIMNYRSVISI